jgi:hypothetical protein
MSSSPVILEVDCERRDAAQDRGKRRLLTEGRVRLQAEDIPDLANHLIAMGLVGSRNARPSAPR